MRLNDKLIQGTIDGISGFIVASASARLGKSVEETQELFLASKTCAMLNNKETGLYWDSILETLDNFLAEVRHPASRC